MVGTSGLFQGNFAGFLVKINELKYNLFSETVGDGEFKIIFQRKTNHLKCS